jgi:hypothetical protein
MARVVGLGRTPYAEAVVLALLSPSPLPLSATGANGQPGVAVPLEATESLAQSVSAIVASASTRGVLPKLPGEGMGIIPLPHRSVEGGCGGVGVYCVSLFSG